MKKILAFTLSLAMIMSLLASCGGDTADSSTSAADSSNTTTSSDTNAASSSNTATTPDTNVAADTSGAPDGIVAGSSITMCSGSDIVTMLMPGSQTAAAWFYAYIYDTLFWSPSGQWDDMTGLMVDTYTLSDDGLVWTLDLHENITTAAGVNLDAQKIYDSHMILMENGQSIVFSAMESYEVTGEYQLTVTYTAPNPEFMFQLSVPHTSAFDPTGYQELGDHVDAYYMAGSGPYYISDYAVGDYLTFTANENHWNADRMAHIETLNCKIITNTDTQITALQAGEIDYGPITGYSNYETIVFSGADVNIAETYGVVRPLWVNASGDMCPYLAIDEVRQALTMMIDTQQLSDAASGGYGQVAKNAFGSDLDYQDNRTYDPDGALALLDSVGVSPSDIAITALADAATSTIMSNLQAQLMNYGVTVNFVVQDSPAVTSAGWAGEWDIWAQPGGLNGIAYNSPVSMLFNGAHDVCKDVDIDSTVSAIVTEAFQQIALEDELAKLCEVLEILDENYAYLAAVQVNGWVGYSDKLENVAIDRYYSAWRAWESWVAY